MELQIVLHMLSHSGLLPEVDTDLPGGTWPVKNNVANARGSRFRHGGSTLCGWLGGWNDLFHPAHPPILQTNLDAVRVMG